MDRPCPRRRLPHAQRTRRRRGHRRRRPRRGEVTIQLAAPAACHSDLSATNGTIAFPPPLVLGHEGAGTVVEVGEG